MPQGPENRMLKRLKPKLEADLGVEIEKTNNIFRSGRPDWDVFGQGGACGFIEAKFWKRQAKPGQIVNAEKIVDMCSDLQKKWMFDKAEMQHAVAVLCGFKTRDSYAFVIIDDCVSHPTEIAAVSYADLAGQIKRWLYNHVEKETL